jgi:Protein of unknown function (DUF3768)
MNMPVNHTEMIAALNDRFRSSPVPAEVQGMKVMTRGIAALDQIDRLEVWQAVQDFSKFTEDNDPHGEHDFGAFDHPRAGKVFWKIDYYDDEVCRYGSEHPYDPARSYRVLTIMRADEY